MSEDSTRVSCLFGKAYRWDRELDGRLTLQRYRGAMPAYASPEAEHVAHGIRLGGRGHLLDQAVSSQPFTVEALERIIRPDLYDEQDDDELSLDAQPLGRLRVYPSQDSHTIACDWYGWLPGHYTTRDAALVAYGYILGGEKAGPLDKLAQPRPEGYTLAEIETFAATA